MDLNTKIPSRGRALDMGEEDPTTYMNDSILQLAKKGADFVVIPCNTSHYFYDGFIKNIDIPVLNIIQETSNYIKNNNPNISKVGLMSSKNTSKYKLYNKFLENDGINIILPQDQQEVSNIIESVKIGNDEESIQRKAKKVAKKLIENGAQGLILGCTEIPLVINVSDFTIPIFDSNKILALACIDKIRSN